MYRSASTLQFQIASHLVQTADRGQQVGWIDAYRFAETQSIYSNQATADAPMKVVKVHTCTESIAAEFTQSNAIGIYTFRDLRDVYASYLKQRQKSFEELWQEELVENCLTNYAKWTSLPRVLVSQYEQIISDLVTEVSRIASHLGIALSQSECQAIANDYTFTNQQVRVQKFREQLLQQALDSNDHRDIVDYHDEESLLHMNHLDSGQVGRWQTELSSQQVDRIEASVKQWCEANGYSVKLFLRSLPVNS